MKKKIQFAAFLALMVFGAISSLQALPPGGTGFDDIFYSDGTFTTPVGWRYMQCESGLSTYGQITPWVESYAWDCVDEQVIADPCPSNLHYCQEGTYIRGYLCECA